METVSYVQTSVRISKSHSQINKSVTGIQALISKLRISGEPASATAALELGEDEQWLNPLDADVYCNNGTETALHCAVRKGRFTYDVHKHI